MAEERRLRIEREAEEEPRRTEEEARRTRETKRLQRMEERQRLEEERDARLLSSEMRKDREEERERYEKKGKMAAKSSGMIETIYKEKERLRRIIAPRTMGAAEVVEDEELVPLRMLACKLGLTEKRKCGPDIPVGNSPPVVTPEKKPAGMLTNEARAHIELLKTEHGNGQKKVNYKSDTGKLVEIRIDDRTENTVKVIETLRSLTRRRGSVVLHCNGGRTWADGWRLVRRLLGESRVKIGRRSRPLRCCKSKFETAGAVTLNRVTEASPASIALRDDLIRMFKCPPLQKDLRTKNISELMKYYSAVKTFATKRSRSKARLMITRAIRDGNGLNVRTRIVVKTQYDERIKKSEIMRVVRRKVGGMQMEATLKDMVKRRARVVWKKGPNVGDLLHNHRRFSSTRATSCPCSVNRILEVRDMLDGLVLAPLDRNPGDTVVMCPLMYDKGMEDTILVNAGYRLCTETEERLLTVARVEYGQRGLSSQGKWDKKGRIGCAYALPKHKDTARFRPICPTFNEPSVKACKMVAKGINCLFFSLPESGHFNLSTKLACLMCAKSEWDFLLSLDSQRHRFAGLRFVDDVSVFTTYNTLKKGDKQRAEQLMERFTRCYDEASTLKQTDDGEESWTFLGYKLSVQREFRFLDMTQALENDQQLREKTDLPFRTIQDFHSFSSKQAKLAVIINTLHRIDQNSCMGMDVLETLILFRSELRRNNYPGPWFSRALRNYSKGKAPIWKMFYQMFTNYE
ncbi:hypothetical protein CBR_g39272 [Chara braunii]|uniref:Uncharacterized protein n=1 Tax=Chara braunii TaxID=69332 RepID=A0A388K0Z0_CHABU|nr:hypothetical protein CBR_g39272 [Chara braunii]|eukprot:GBG63730.1 hypothetical protein CBR_g39272 [Chara braunii]